MKKRRCSDFGSRIESPYHEIQVSCETYPGKIWEHQPAGEHFDFEKFNGGDTDEHKKDKKPDECGKICTEIEEYNAPAKVENKLGTVKQKRRVKLFAV